EQAAVLADGQPDAVRERIAEAPGQRHPALRVQLIAVRAEQFGHASSPFLHFDPPLCHYYSTGSTADQRKGGVSCRRSIERQRPTRGGTGGEGLLQVVLPAGLEPAERQT